MSASPPSQTPSATSDAELLAGFVVRHDQDAFAELVRKHGPLVYRACRRVLGGVQDAEDVFQATFVVLARKAATIAPPEMVGSWLYGVACRLALKARAQGQRRQARERVGAGAILVQCPHGSAGVEGNANEVRPILDEELLRLSETYRLPLVLCYLEGKSHTEVAQQLGCQEPALRQRLLRGREQLRERLARRGLGASLAVLATVLTQEGAKAAHPAHGAPSFAVFPSTSSEGLTPQVAALADSLAPSSATVFRPRLLVIGVLFSLATLSAWWSMRPAAPIHVVWRFSKGPASDLRVARGQWQHRADGPGVMGGGDVVVMLPTDLPRGPFAISVKWKPIMAGRDRRITSRVMPVWTDGDQSLPRQVWAAQVHDTWDQRAFMHSRAVFNDRWSAVYLDGKLWTLNEYERAYPSLRAMLILQNADVEEIELKELTVDEVPTELRDIRRTLAPMVKGLADDI